MNLRNEIPSEHVLVQQWNLTSLQDLGYKLVPLYHTVDHSMFIILISLVVCMFVWAYVYSMRMGTH